MNFLNFLLALFRRFSEIEVLCFFHIYFCHLKLFFFFFSLVFHALHFSPLITVSFFFFVLALLLFFIAFGFVLFFYYASLKFIKNKWFWCSKFFSCIYESQTHENPWNTVFFSSPLRHNLLLTLSTSARIYVREISNWFGKANKFDQRIEKFRVVEKIYGINFKQKKDKRMKSEVVLCGR